jgi:hypothetical protein
MLTIVTINLLLDGLPQDIKSNINEARFIAQLVALHISTEKQVTL